MVNKVIICFLLLNSLITDGDCQSLLQMLRDTPYPVSVFYNLVLRSSYASSFNGTDPLTTGSFYTVFVPPNAQLTAFLAGSTQTLEYVNRVVEQYTYTSNKNNMLTIQYLNAGVFPPEVPIQGYSGTNYGRGNYIVIETKSSGSFFIFRQSSLTGVNVYYINNAQFVQGASNNFANNGVFHLITDVLEPLGSTININAFLLNNLTRYSTMNTMVNSFPLIADENAIRTYFLAPAAGSRTYSITPNSAWEKVPPSELALINANRDRRWKIVFDHLIPNQVVYTSSLTETTSVQLGDWMVPNSPVNFNNYVPPTRFFFRDRQGNNYVEDDTVTSLITSGNIPIDSALVHLVDWPIGVKYGYFRDVLNNTLYGVSSFQTVCTANTFCSGIIGTSPSPTYNTLFAPQGYPATTSPNSNETTRIIAMHIIPKFQLTRRQLRFDNVFYNSTNTTASIRINFDLSNNTYIEARPWNSTQGYVSGKLLFADRTKLSGVAQIISRPFGFYNYTMEQYMNSRPDLYSTYIPYYQQIGANAVMNKTVFAPTNAALEAMSLDTFNNGRDILLNPYTRGWVLRTMVLINVKLMLEDQNVPFAESYTSMNTQFDLYNPVVRVIKSTAIGGKTGELWVTDTSISITLHTGGIEALDGIIYPVDRVLYKSADIDPPCISRLCRASLMSPKLLGLFIVFLITQIHNAVISS